MAEHISSGHDRRNTVRTLALDGLMAALSIILTRFLSLNIPIGGGLGARVGLGHLPIVVVGILLGPVHGFLVGVVADVVGHFLWPAGAYVWQVTAISALNGFIPALIIRFGRIRSRFVRVWVGVAVARLVLSVGWLPFALHAVLGLPYWPVLAGQAAGSLIMIPATALLTNTLVEAYERAGFGHVRG